PIQAFIEGRVMPGESSTSKPTPATPIKENAIDAVVFVIPIKTASDLEMLERLPKDIEQALRAGIRKPFVVVNRQKELSSEENSAAKEKLLAGHPVPMRNVFFIDNYDNEVFRSAEKDIEYWLLLESVFNAAVIRHEELEGSNSDSNSDHN